MRDLTKEEIALSKYVFSDGDISGHFITDKKDRVNFNFDSELTPTDTIGFNMIDAIIIAKALGATAEDFK